MGVKEDYPGAGWERDFSAQLEAFQLPPGREDTPAGCEGAVELARLAKGSGSQWWNMKGWH